jgi:O-antigen/teichoic acid export membrane protein
VVGSAAATLVSVGLTYFIVPYMPRIRLTHIKELMNFSIWLSLGTVLNTLNSRLDQLVIGYFMGKHPLGIYTVAENLSYMPTREATAPIAQTLFPAFATLVDQPDRLRRAYQLGQSTICAVVLPVGIGFALLAHALVLLTIGSKWIEAIPIIQVLAVIFALQSLSSCVIPLAMAKGATRQLFGRDMRSFGFRVPTLIVGFISYGIMGIVIARAVSGVLDSLINMSLVSKLLGLPIIEQIKANVRAIGATLVMVLAVSIVQGIMENGPSASALISIAVTSIAAGGIAYVVALFLFWAASGKPVGPETELLKLAKSAVRKLTARRAAYLPE